MPAEGTALEEASGAGGKTVHQVGAPAERADGETTADDLAEEGEIGADGAEALEAGGSEAETDDFIHDEDELHLLGDAANEADEFGVDGEDAGAGIEQDGGELGVVALEQAGDGLALVVG